LKTRLDERIGRSLGQIAHRSGAVFPEILVQHELSPPRLSNKTNASPDHFREKVAIDGFGAISPLADACQFYAKG
jgi:hypothetical protein